MFEVNVKYVTEKGRREPARVWGSDGGGWHSHDYIRVQLPQNRIQQVLYEGLSVAAHKKKR